MFDTLHQRAASGVCWLVLGASLLTCGCVDGDYNRSRVFQPPLEAAVESLVPGTTQLEGALASLGAPLRVIEVGRGMALAWGWEDTTNWNVEVSAPLGDAQGNFSFTSTSATTRGLVLFFDEHESLTSVQRGYLSELVPARQRPRDVEDELID